MSRLALASVELWAPSYGTTRFMKRLLMDDLLRERNAYAKRVMADVRGRRRELERAK